MGKNGEITPLRSQTGAGVRYLGDFFLIFAVWGHLRASGRTNEENQGEMRPYAEVIQKLSHPLPRQERSLFGLTKPNIPHSFLPLSEKPQPSE